MVLVAQRVPVVPSVPIVHSVPVIQRVPVVQEVRRTFLSYGLAWGCHSPCFFPAGSFRPTPPRCASMPTRQQPPHIDHPNISYFFCSLHASTQDGTEHIWIVWRQPHQSPSRCRLTPRDSGMSFELCGIPVLDISSRSATGLHPIVPSHLQMASRLQALMMWHAWLGLCIVVLSRQSASWNWLDTGKRTYKFHRQLFSNPHEQSWESSGVISRCQIVILLTV